MSSTTLPRSLLSVRGSDLAAALAAALVALLALALGYGAAWPLAVDVGGGRDARFALGFNEPERTESVSFRWTDGDSTLALPRPPATAPAVLALRLQNGRPDAQPPAQVAVSADGRELARLTLTDNLFRTYHLLVPPAERLDWALRVDLAGDSILLPADPRPLGVVLDRASLAPAGAPLPSAWVTLCAIALGALGYALPRLAGLGRGAALAFSTLLAALVAALIAALPLDVLPFVQRFAALAGVWCLGLVVARLLAPPILPTNHGPPTRDESSAVRRPLSVRGEHLPIYMAVAWWCMPLFQLAMIRDGAPGVGLAPQTLWIGAGLVLALAGLGAWSYRSRARDQQPETHETPQHLTSGERSPVTDGPSSVGRRPRPVADYALVIFAAAAGAHLAYNIWYAYTRSAPDFWILFRGAREWARGGSLYDLEAVMTNHFGHVFKVPPFYGMLFVPFVFQDGLTVLLFHRVINTVLIALTALAWLRMWRLPVRSLAGAAVLVLLNFRPLADTIAYGQIDLVLLLLLVLALWALRVGDSGVRQAASESGQRHAGRGNAALASPRLTPHASSLSAGFLVALGTLFKIYPVVLLAFFVIKRRWWALAGFALGMLVCNGVALAVMGWEMHRVYLTQVVPNIGGTTSWVENQTISGVVARLLDSPREADIFTDAGLRLLGTALSGLAVLVACALTLRPAKRDSTLFALQYSQFLLLMVLTVPAAWMHYETLLFVPFAALLLHLRGRAVPLPRAGLLALSFALIAYGNQWSFYDGTIMGALTIAGVSYKFYGMLLLGGLLAAELLRGWQPLALLRQAPAAHRQAV